MASVVRTHTFNDGDVLTASQLNGEFNNLLNALAIVNTDISGSAAIAVSKIATGLTGSLVGTTDTQTLSAKRITKRTETIADGISITPNFDNADISEQSNTQASGTLTINNPSGTPNDGDGHVIRIKSTNSQTYAFGTSYKGGAIALPTSHAGASKTDYLGFIYNSVTSTYDLVAVQQAVG